MVINSMAGLYVLIISHYKDIISLNKGWMTIPLTRIIATLEPSIHLEVEFLHDGK